MATFMNGVAVGDVSDRTQIELTGNDRKSFLHNMSTNEINDLPVGAGCEAFLTNAQGKILAHVCFFQTPESIVLETVPDQMNLMEHLDRYLIREDVALHDRSSSWGELLLAGPKTVELLQANLDVPPPDQPLANTQATLFGSEVSLRRTTLAGPVGYLIACPREDLQSLIDSIVQAGALRVGQDALDAARIESGWPAYGRDITIENLPQEIGRDSLAISFTKGCYIGQETVARIDALGHVNKRLVGLRCDTTEVPPPQTPLFLGDRKIGRITSAAYSPQLKTPLALGYVHRDSQQPGTQVESPLGPVEVVSLPVDPVNSP